jgi:hypothetical protein
MERVEVNRLFAELLAAKLSMWMIVYLTAFD